MAENKQGQLNGDATATEINGRLEVIVAEAQSESAQDAFTQSLREVLNAQNYEVVWKTAREVLYGSDETTADAVILDAAPTDINALCERLKRAANGESAAQDSASALTPPLLAVIREDANFQAFIASGVASGVDGFLSEKLSAPEIKSQLSLAVRLGQVQRELQATREELRHQIQIDDLSGTLNRRFFFQSAYRECSRARRYGQALSCLMVDIDHFHLYNTSFGYGCGDYMLREVATVLKNSVRDTDLVARFGGSKFVILLTHTDTQGAMMVRQKIENSIKGGYFVWQHQRLPVTVSIGEAERVPGRSYPNAPEEGEDDAILLSTREDLAELLEDADSALYVAKKGARFPTFLEVSAEQAED